MMQPWRNIKFALKEAQKGPFHWKNIFLLYSQLDLMRVYLNTAANYGYQVDLSHPSVNKLRHKEGSTSPDLCGICVLKHLPLLDRKKRLALSLYLFCRSVL